MSDQMNLWDTPNATSSQASADGRSRSDSRGGPTTGPCGPPPSRANLSARQAKEKGLLTSDTCGPPSGGSSHSAGLQRSLASRLQAALAGTGSPEYALTWKHWDMQSGPPICALRASGRRKSGSGSGGWPSPTASTGEKNVRSAEGAAKEAKRKGWGSDLSVMAHAAGWVTPSSRGWKDTPGMKSTGTNPDGSDRKRLDQLPRQAAIAGYPTPRANDGEKRGQVANNPRNGLPGTAQHGLLAPTVNRGTLNPALSRWIMGYPVEWCVAAIRANRKKKRR